MNVEEIESKEKELYDLRNALAENQEALAEKQKEIDNFEIDLSEYEDHYRESLDEQGPVSIGTLQFDRSRILEELDPTAYRCGLNDFVDMFYDDLDSLPEYKELKDELQEIQDEIDANESDIDDLENEITELKDELEDL